MRLPAVASALIAAALLAGCEGPYFFPCGRPETHEVSVATTGFTGTLVDVQLLNSGAFVASTTCPGAERSVILDSDDGRVASGTIRPSSFNEIRLVFDAALVRLESDIGVHRDTAISVLDSNSGLLVRVNGQSVPVTRSERHADPEALDDVVASLGQRRLDDFRTVRDFEVATSWNRGSRIDASLVPDDADYGAPHRNGTLQIQLIGPEGQRAGFHFADGTNTTAFTLRDPFTALAAVTHPLAEGRWQLDVRGTASAAPTQFEVRATLTVYF